MKAKEFFNNGKYEPKDIVDWGDEGVYYSIEDIEAYAKQEVDRKDKLLEKFIRCWEYYEDSDMEALYQKIKQELKINI